MPKALRAGTLVANLGRDSASAYFQDLTFLKPSDTHRLMGPSCGAESSLDAVAAVVTDTYRRCPSADAVQRAEYADLKVYLPNDPLVKVDRMSMAHGLEVRCPLLDRRVVELAFRIPASKKQVGLQGKALLRQLAQRRLPSGLWKLPKRGFSMPIGEWIAGPSAATFREEVLTPNALVSSLVDRVDLERRFSLHAAGVQDQSYALWAVWTLERWLRAAR
jgi:asparagine synthase (glutamine-hydrolysing)